MAGESVIRRLDEPADVAEKAAEQVAEQDFQSFSEALGSSARGRAFLAEYARRNRHADTEAVLAVLHRLEESTIKKSGSADADRIRQDLRALLDTLRTARPQTENSPTAIKAATLAALIDFTQARIEAVIGMPAGLRESEPVVAVPAPDQPELPIPHPSAAATTGPVMALVHTPPPTAERPNIAVTNAAIVAPLTKARELTGIPIVEFDYRPQLAARPEPPQEQIDEAWTALAPPSITAPREPVAAQAAAPVEVARAPEPFVPAEIAPVEAAPQPAAKPEPYELWLDEPPVAEPEPQAVASELAAQDVAAPDVTATQPAEQVVEETPVFLPATDFMVPVKAETVSPPAAMKAPAAPPMTAIEALVQQMEKASTPATPVAALAPIKGKADAIDPLAPITALSEEERIALFS